jgi:phospholipid/cholesterol/gamma-HCH transport system substrate-binding protein
VVFGLLVLLGALAGVAWYFLASSRYTIFEIRTRESVSGLIADAPVEFHGVEVGKVKRVQLIDPHSVSIVLAVRQNAPITRATIATITSRGLAARGFTGYVYVALDNVGDDSRPLKAPSGSPFPLIPTASSRSVSLDTTIGEVKRDVRVLTDLLQSILDQKTVASLKHSIDNLQKVTQTLTTNSGKLNAMIVNAERASRQMKPLLDSSQETVEALQGQILPEAYDTLVKLHDLSTSVQEITAEIQRDPSVLVRGKSPPQPGPGEKP